MTTNGFGESEPRPWPESAEERAARLEWERRALDAARASLAAGKGISGDELDELLDAFARGEELPARKRK